MIIDHVIDSNNSCNEFNRVTRPTTKSIPRPSKNNLATRNAAVTSNLKQSEVKVIKESLGIAHRKTIDMRGCSSPTLAKVHTGIERENFQKRKKAIQNIVRTLLTEDTAFPNCDPESSSKQTDKDTTASSLSLDAIFSLKSLPSAMFRSRLEVENDSVQDEDWFELDSRSIQSFDTLAISDVTLASTNKKTPLLCMLCDNSGLAKKSSAYQLKSPETMNREFANENIKAVANYIASLVPVVSFKSNSVGNEEKSLFTKNMTMTSSYRGSSSSASLQNVSALGVPSENDDSTLLSEDFTKSHMTESLGTTMCSFEFSSDSLQSSGSCLSESTSRNLKYRDNKTPLSRGTATNRTRDVFGSSQRQSESLNLDRALNGDAIRCSERRLHILLKFLAPDKLSLFCGETEEILRENQDQPGDTKKPFFFNAKVSRENAKTQNCDSASSGIDNNFLVETPTNDNQPAKQHKNRSLYSKLKKKMVKKV